MKTHFAIKPALGLAVALACLASAHAATPFLEWNFNALPSPIPAGEWTVEADASGHGRYGFVIPEDGAMTRVASPLPVATPDYAVQFDSYHASSQVKRDITASVGALFNSGLASRLVVQVDSAVSGVDGDYYQHLSRYRSGVTGDAVFGMQYLYSATNGFDLNTVIATSAGTQTLNVSKATIESAIGYGIVGKPVVYTMSWDEATNNLAVYANGQPVGSLTTTGTLAMNLGTILIGYDGNSPTSRQGIYDDVKIWVGSLSAGEVLADYNTFPPIPEPATVILLGLGGLVFLRRR